MKKYPLGFLMIALSGMALGQSVGSMSGPSLGVVFDSNARMVRPLIGVTGSTTVGETLDVGMPLSDSIALLDQHSILAVPQDGSFLTVIDLGQRPVHAHTLEGVDKNAETTLSPNGQTAVLSYGSSERIAVIGGLPENPGVMLNVSTAVVTGKLLRAVVNDAGNLLLVVFQDGNRDTLYRWNASEGFRLLATLKRAGALRFVADSEAVFSDAGSNELYFALDVQNSSVTQLIAAANDGVANPVGIASAASGGFYVANGETHTVVRFDANRRITRTLQCNCTISGLNALGMDVYQLTARLDQTLYLLDDANPAPRIVFVPPVPPQP